MKLKRSIILEGPDGSGKTTLYRLMTDTWGLKPGGHDGGPPTPEEVEERLAKFEELSPCVRDRSPAVSSLVYPTALGTIAPITKDMALDWLRKVQAVVVFCRPPTSYIVASNLAAKGHKPEDLVQQVIAQRKNIINLYDDVFVELVNMPGVLALTYDYTVDPLGNSLLKELKWWEICAD